MGCTRLEAWEDDSLDIQEGGASSWGKTSATLAAANWVLFVFLLVLFLNNESYWLYRNNTKGPAGDDKNIQILNITDSDIDIVNTNQISTW